MTSLPWNGKDDVFPPVLINIRGTGGSGKSTLVTRIMAELEVKVELYELGRKRPVGYQFPTRKIFIPGHYEIACGGCDTLKTVDRTYEMIHERAASGYSVLYEGIMVMDDVRRAVEISKKFPLLVIGLTTPLEDCIAAIQARRDAKGKEEKLNPKNTIARDERCKRGLFRLKDAGVAVEKLDRETAFQRVKGLLCT